MKPFIYQEVIDLGWEPIKSSEYIPYGRITEFKYGFYISQVFRKHEDKLLRYLSNFGEPWAFVPEGDAVVFIDNHGIRTFCYW